MSKAHRGVAVKRSPDKAKHRSDKAKREEKRREKDGANQKVMGKLEKLKSEGKLPAGTSGKDKIRIADKLAQEKKLDKMAEGKSQARKTSAADKKKIADNVQKNSDQAKFQNNRDATTKMMDAVTKLKAEGKLPAGKTSDALKKSQDAPRTPAGTDKSKKSSSIYPATDSTFDSLSDQKNLAAALENQDNLKTLQREFPEYHLMKKLAGRVSIGLDANGKPTLSIENPHKSIGESAKDVATDFVFNEVLERAFGLIAKDLASVPGLVLDLADVAGKVKAERLMGGKSQEAKDWQEQQTIILIADKLAPEFVRNQPPGMFKTFEGERWRLIKNYWRTERAINQQVGNLMKYDSRSRAGSTLPSISQN